MISTIATAAIVTTTRAFCSHSWCFPGISTLQSGTDVAPRREIRCQGKRAAGDAEQPARGHQQCDPHPALHPVERQQCVRKAQETCHEDAFGGEDATDRLAP